MSILQEREQVPRSERSCSIHPTNKWHCLPIALLIQVVYSFHHIVPPCLTLFSKHCSYSIDVIAKFNGEIERCGWKRDRQGSVGRGGSIQGSLRTHTTTFLFWQRGIRTWALLLMWDPTTSKNRIWNIWDWLPNSPMSPRLRKLCVIVRTEEFGIFMEGEMQQIIRCGPLLTQKTGLRSLSNYFCRTIWLEAQLVESFSQTTL